jgi:hypothetical protein
MKRKILSLAVLLTLGITASVLMSSSHREAPLIAKRWP